MGVLARVLRPSGLTHGRPPCSFLPSLGDVVPMVSVLVIKVTYQLFNIKPIIELPSSDGALSRVVSGHLTSTEILNY
jgi:hypothetical protein